MNRDAIGPAFLALVCVIAVVLAAATLTSTQQPGGDGIGPTEGGGAGGGEQKAADAGGQKDAREGLVDLGKQGKLPALCLGFLNNPLVQLGAVLAMLGLAVYTYRRADVVASAGVTLGLGGPVALGWILLSSCSQNPKEDPQDGLPEMLSKRASGGGGGAGTSGDPNGVVQTFDVPILLYLALGLLLVAVVAVALSHRDSMTFSVGLSPVIPDFEDPDEGNQAEVFEGGTAGVGRAAGRAADRIEADADVENEVYRAWAEMTEHLEVDHPDSSTPAEFAVAAVAAGMDREDVEELTRLFEEVRYGGQAATEERERRAVAALRRIESAYAGGRS